MSDVGEVETLYAKYDYRLLGPFGKSPQVQSVAKALSALLMDGGSLPVLPLIHLIVDYVVPFQCTFIFSLSCSLRS